MPAEVETMFYSGQVPWHGLGTKLDKPATAREAIIAAKLDWKVAVVPLFAAIKEGFDETPHIVKCLENNAVVRLSDESVLGVVGVRYEPLQNIDTFGFFDPIVGRGEAIYHTAGSLKNGKRVWVLAQLPGDILVTADDVIERYILLTNTHDGSGAIRAFFTPVRVVCMNTLNVSLNIALGKGVSIRHVGDVKGKLAEAHKLLKIGDQFFTELQENAKRMLAVKADVANPEDPIVTEFLEGVFPDFDRATATQGQINSLAEIQMIANGTTGTLTKASVGTLWGYFNAVTEFVDHKDSRGTTIESRADNKLDSIWFSGGRTIKQRAYQVAMEMASR